MRKYLFFMVMLLSMTLITIAQDSELPYEEIIGATTVSNVNLRGDASTDNPAIGTLGQGEQVIILEEIPDGQSVSGNPLWYQVQLPDESEAYIWAGLLSEPEVISRRCLTTLEADPDALWLVDREDQNTPMMQLNLETQMLTSGGRTGENPSEWRVVVTAEELETELGLVSSDTLTVESYSDPESCRMVGATVQQQSFIYYAVRQSIDSVEIRFIPSQYVLGTSQGDANTLLSNIEEWNIANPDAIQAMELEAINPNFRSALNNVPDSYYEIIDQNGSDFGVYKEIINPTFNPINDTLEMMNGDDPEKVIMIWTSQFGWTIPQFDTKLARISLTYNFTTPPKNSNDGRILNLRPVTSAEQIRQLEDGDNWVANDWTPDVIDFLHQIRGEIEFSPLTNDPENGMEAIDNAILTTFAILYFETDEPTEEQLFFIRDEWETGESSLSVDTYLGEWGLQTPVNIISDRMAGYINANIVFVKDGQLTIRTTLARDDGWAISTGISKSLSDLVENSGIPSRNFHTEQYSGTIMDYHAIDRALLILYDNVLISPIMAGSTPAYNPGYIRYKI